MHAALKVVQNFAHSRTVCVNPIESANFPPNLRLLNGKQFERVFADPIRFGNYYITVLATENQLDHPRLGMAISKKCAKRAVDRNRIKRILRDSFRHQAHTLPPADFVVMCRSSILELDNPTLRKQIEKQWHFIRKRFKHQAQTQED